MEKSPFINYLNTSINLTHSEELIIIDNLKHRKYLKGQYILQQGDSCNFLSFVATGLTKTFHIDNHGNEHIFRFAKEEWWSADLPSFFNSEISNTNIQCLEHTEVFQISFNNLEILYKEVPKLEHFFRILFQKVSVSLEKRIINNLSYTAKERYYIFQKNHPEFIQRIPQYMIASYLGISKQYLSEIRNQ